MQGKAFGLLILLVGAVLLLSNVGVLPYMTIGYFFSQYWPALLIYWGVVSYIESSRWKGWFGVRLWPIALILFGAGFLLENLGFVTGDLWNVLIPAACIVVGIGILFGKKSRRGAGIYFSTKEEAQAMKQEWQDAWKSDWKDGWAGEWSSSGRPRRQHSSMLGDMKLGGPGFQLEDARIEQKAGSIRLDLCGTEIPLGETTLDIECKVGDVDVLVPDGLAVEVHAQVKIGDIKVFHQRNSGRGTLHYTSDNYTEAERKVKLFILVKIGDIDVKQVG